MNFNDHSKLKGLHAFLSPSSSAWVNYDKEKLAHRHETAMAAERGTRIHAFAAEAIELGIKLPKSKRTLNAYINDAIGYRMTPEQVLYATRHCFGTADAICYEDRAKILRIHDLKTGESPASIRQLKIYAAIFCIEYHINPMDIFIELRVYQLDSVEVCNNDIQENLQNEISELIRIIIDDSAFLDELEENGGIVA